MSDPLKMGFRGAARALAPAAIIAVAQRLGVEEAALRAVIEIESPRGPFDAKGRPTILYEGHVFWRNLLPDQREDANRAGLAWPHWDRSRYPRGGSDAMYQVLERACEIDPAAAMMACSWGSPQILGENYAEVGFPTVEAMVMAFMDSAEAQIDAMAAYIRREPILTTLRAKDWAGFAQLYNGPGYTQHRYDERLAEAYARLAPPPADVAAEVPEPVPAAPVLVAPEADGHPLGGTEGGLA